MRWRSRAQKTMGATSATRIPTTTGPQEATARAAGYVPTPGVAAAPKRAAPAPAPAQIRVLTAPRRSADVMAFPEERSDINITPETVNMSTSLALMGNGIAKILDGLGLKIDAKDEEQESGKKEESGEGTETNKKESTASEDAEKKKEEAEKQKRLAVVLGLPDFILNASKVIDGINEVFSGGKDTAFLLGQKVRGLPGLIRKKASGLRYCSGSIMTSIPSMGSGHHGLRMILKRQTVTRTCGGRLQVFDGFGLRKSRVPQNLCGTRFISTHAELTRAIIDFRAGKLNQWLDVDMKRTSLEAAQTMWRTICSEELTDFVVQDCPLAAMALQAGALLEEKKAVEAHLITAEGVVDNLNSCVAFLNEKLSGSHEASSKYKQD